MNGIKDAVFKDKNIWLLGKNQYTSNVEAGSTRREIKHWIEHFFGVKVIVMNSHWLSGKGRRMRPIMGYTMHYNRMIITIFDFNIVLSYFGSEILILYQNKTMAMYLNVSINY